MNSDWLDLLQELRAAGARFLLVGAHAVGVHGIPRATRDIDVWVEATAENAARVIVALTRFGAPLQTLGVEQGDFTHPGRVVQLGVAPNRIDLMTSVSGLDSFDAAFANRLDAVVEGVPVPVLGLRELITNKRASGRPKDLLDLEWLERS